MQVFVLINSYCNLLCETSSVFYNLTHRNSKILNLNIHKVMYSHNENKSLLATKLI